MHRGYTKRWRKRWDKGYHLDHLLWVMMDYFIDFANWKDKEFPFVWKGALVEMVKIKRGQCFFTIKGLKDLLNSPLNPVSRKMIRRRIKILEKIGFLAHKQGHQYQVVTILNYDLYNPIDEDEAHKQVNQSPTNGTSIAHQSATTNKVKKDNKEKEKRNTPVASFSNNHWKEKTGEFYKSILESCNLISSKCKIENKKFNPFQWVQQKANQKAHPGAINEALKGIIKMWATIDNPWGYIESIFKTVNGNWNEKEAINIHNQLKNIEIPELKEITQGLLKNI